jgi:hypothetical protein
MSLLTDLEIPLTDALKESLKDGYNAEALQFFARVFKAAEQRWQITEYLPPVMIEASDDQRPMTADEAAEFTMKSRFAATFLK